MNKSPLKTQHTQIYIQNDRLVFGAYVLGVFILCLLLYPLSGTFIGKFFTADFGIISNLTLIVLILAFGLIMRTDMRYERSSAATILICLLLAGEELHWLIPFDDKKDMAQQIRTLKELIIASLGEMPDKAGLELSISIAAARFVMLALPFYMLGFSIKYRKKISEYIEKSGNCDEVFYASFFIAFFILSIFCHSYSGGLMQIFEKGLNLIIAICLTLYILVKAQNRHNAMNQAK